jgi:hypothetical protein
MDRRPTMVALVAGAVLVSACGAAGHAAPSSTITRLDVARGASAQLGQQTHEPAPTIDCANDLPDAAGATEQCAETDFTRGQRHSVTVRIDRLDGNTPHYSVVVGDAPLPPPEN